MNILVFTLLKQIYLQKKKHIKKSKQNFEKKIILLHYVLSKLNWNTEKSTF